MSLIGPVFILFLSLFSCKWPTLLESQNQTDDPYGSKPSQDYSGKAARNFTATNLVNSQPYTVDAVLLAENSQCAVYAERSAGISVETAENIASKFVGKDGIDQLMKKYFGDFRESLKNMNFGRYDKLILLLLDIKDGYVQNTSSSYIAGYFYPNDMYNLASSNKAAMLYLDVYPGDPASGEFFNTVVHEMQHLINYSFRLAQKGGGSSYAAPQDTWIDEGLASSAEYLYSGKHIQSKIDYFNADRWNVFSRGNTFFTWDNEYDDYCTVYLFFQWLRIHANGNPEIYKDILTSNYLDYRAVIQAAKKHIGGDFAEKQEDLEIWETLLGRWFLANHINAPEGLLGYNKEITTQIRATTGSIISLAPGEGVFSYLDGKGFTLPANAQSGAHIRYLGVTQGGKLINTQEELSLSKETGRILTFNVDTTVKTRTNQTDSQWKEEVMKISETGYLTGKVGPEPRAVGIPGQEGASQGPYPVDIPPAFFLERE
jgi:hypothetical protein